MSRRPAPGADRAAQNAQTLKALVKLEGNKVCADCKRNKHPRWASWNLGIFVCIRCSGIHRGMGTHISRVKSVDLDAWTDEQLQSVIKWGNTRANRYWEAKLAEGHQPSEAKIENFIRTKYETKRWVMDGPMPDPATLDTDDDVPLNIVQEKAKIERSTSQRQSNSQQTSVPQSRQPPRLAQPSINLFDDFTPDPLVRPSTADIPSTRTVAPPPVRAQKPQESLLGLDFFGSQQAGAGISRPTSAASTPASATNPRGDLKNSILSLYANTPKPAPQPAAYEQPSAFGGMSSPSAPQDAFGGLTDAFSSISFSNGNQTQQPAQVQSPSSVLSGLSFATAVPTKTAPAAPQITSPPPLSGGSFFDTPAPKVTLTTQSTAPSNGLDFSFTTTATPASPKPSKPATSQLPMNLFDDDGFNSFSSPAPVAAAPISKPVTSPKPTSSDFGSPFNLSAHTATTAPMAPPPNKPSSGAGIAQPASLTFDPWGSGNDSNAWGAPEPAPAKSTGSKVELGSVPSHLTPNDISGGWGAPISSSNKPSTQPTIAADEDFGGWTSAPTPAAAANNGKPGGFGGSSDPFDNPWG